MQGIILDFVWVSLRNLIGNVFKKDTANLITAIAGSTGFVHS